MTTSPSNPEDYFGREFAPGDLVVYPVRQGSRMWMNHGKVLDVSGTMIKVEVSGHKPSWLKVLDRVVILDPV